ncbi:hypothetical protein [Neobacillus muris]|uniref:hypothetical protein n=1 Tax=Neobacillus muris TaxID=2941334 RepID=UPI00203CB237|nr:hypothetical protein [Neobacillus muris]
MNYSIHDFEIQKLRVDNETIIKVEIFKVPEGYKSCAAIHSPAYDEFDGLGVSIDKDTSIRLALNDLRKQLKEKRNRPE